MNAAPVISYTLGMSRPWTHLFEVTVTFENLPSSPTFDVCLPVWRSGRYVVMDFSGGVVRFEADNAAGKPFAWTQPDPSTWRIATNGSSHVTLRYEVFANEFDLRTRGLNDEHGFVDGTAVFMYAPQCRSLPVRLTVTPYADWHVTTGLDQSSANVFTAPSYDVLVDCPIEIGHQKDITFDVKGVPHVLSLAGEGNYTMDSLVATTRAIVEMQTDYWGDVPYKKYVFMFHVAPGAGGGTEHLNSAVMGLRPFMFRNPDAFQGYVGLVSHEFFHTWNVKRLRPKGMNPYDWQRENMYRELWIAEGATSYVHNLILTRNGYRPVKRFIDDLGPNVGGDRARPGNSVQSLTQCSLEAWVKYWKRNQQAYNFETDYYDKGADVCLLLDLTVRHLSGNAHSFDDVLRTMYRTFPYGSSGYTIDDLQTVATELAGSDLSTFFSNYVHGTTPLDWETILAYAGLVVKEKEQVARPAIGVQTADMNGKVTITRVLAGTSGYDAGLDIGDEILALNGYRVRSAELQNRIGEMEEGEKITLTVFRNDKLREFVIPLRFEEPHAYVVAKTASPTQLQKSIFESWLQTTWEDSSKTGK